ncbi:MAG: NAD(P)-dependent oxidoreductase [Actinomycetota bacterium]
MIRGRTEICSRPDCGQPGSICHGGRPTGAIGWPGKGSLERAGGRKSDMRVSVLGMGRMGEGVALRLAEGGHQVTVWNRSPGKGAEAVAHGATEARTVAEATEGAEVVITSLSNDQAVRSLALGDGGFAGGLHAAVYVDASTISPALSAELAERMDAFVAMPILGNPQAVRSGKALYLLGGPPAALERLEPVVSSLTASTKRYPTAPMASAAKLASNLLLLDAVVALAEAFTVARAGGLDDDEIRSLLSESAMVPAGVRNRFEAVLGHGDASWWTVALGGKDARLAGELARSAGSDLPMTQAAYQRYQDAVAAGLTEADISAVGDLYRT